MRSRSSDSSALQGYGPYTTLRTFKALYTAAMLELHEKHKGLEPDEVWRKAGLTEEQFHLLFDRHEAFESVIPAEHFIRVCAAVGGNLREWLKELKLEWFSEGAEKIYEKYA